MKSSIPTLATMSFLEDYLTDSLLQGPDVGLAAEIAHDIRSPLSLLSVVGRAQVPLAEKIQLIEQAARRLDAIAGKVLDTRRAHLRSSALACCEVQECVEALFAARRITCLKPINFVFEGPRVHLNVEREELEGVLSAIIDNAEESISHVGTVKARVRVVGDRILVTIIDSGPGFEGHVLHEPVGKSSKLRGNGLGLAQVSRQIQGWGGRLNRRSSLDGAEVELDFPGTVRAKA